MRRPREAMAIELKSTSGSKAITERTKPPLPYWLAWQVPALQPARVRTGRTSRSKSARVAATTPLTTTSTVAVASPTETSIRAEPLPTAETTPVSETVATSGVALEKRAAPVRSSMASAAVPSGVTGRTSNWQRSNPPSSVTSWG